LITGIDGFLGSRLADILSNSYRIIGIVRNKNITSRIDKKTYILYNSTPDDIAKLFNENKIYAICHTATKYSSTSLYELHQTNVMLPLFLYEMALKNDVNAFLNTDSFFNSPDSKYSYLNDYTDTKNICLRTLKKTLKNLDDTKLVNMKIFHLYGPNDSKTKFVTQILSKLYNNDLEIHLTPGEQARDFIFIDDVCAAFKIVLRNLSSLESYSEFDVGTGKSVTIKDFVTKAKSIFESDTKLAFGKIPYRDNEIMISKAKIANLQQLGWKPKNRIEAGLSKIKLSMQIP